MTRIEKCCIFATLINQNSSYMETSKRNINLEIATSAKNVKTSLRHYHNLLIEKYNIDGRTYEGAMLSLYEYLDVIDQLEDLLNNPNPWSNV